MTDPQRDDIIRRQSADLERAAKEIDRLRGLLRAARPALNWIAQDTTLMDTALHYGEILARIDKALED